MIRLKRKNSSSEKQILKSYAVKYFKEISVMLGKVPSDLLLVLKTNDCLRHLDMKLGSPVNTTTIVAETVANLVFYENIIDIWLDEKLILSKIARSVPVFWDWYNIMTRILGLKVIKYLGSVHVYFLSFLPSALLL